MSIILSRYLFKKIVVVTFVSLCAITLLLFFIQASKYLDLIISKGLKISYLIQISFLTMPSIWNELLPITIFLSIIASWQILINNNEIVIMQAVGLSPWQIAKPVILIGIISSIICFIFSLFIINTSFIKFLKLKDEIRNNLNISVLGSNKFMQLNNDVTIYIEKADKTNLLKNVLIYNKTSTTEYAIYAEKARILKKGKEIKILLNTGCIQKLNKLKKTVDFINFEVYILDIPEVNKNSLSYQRTTSKNMYLWELIFFNKLKFMQELKKSDYSSYKAKVNSFIIEINKRCINIVLSIALSCIVAYFFSKNCFNRRTQFMPLFKSLLSGILLKIYAISILINTTNLFIITLSYIVILIIIIYIIIKIKRL